MPSKSKVCFFFDKVDFPFRDRLALKSFIERLFMRERKKLVSLNYVFCSDPKLFEINKSWLKHSDYTDIITFDLSELPSRISGEVYISIDRVRENASSFGQSFQQELHRVIFHGALHLCGYKDKKKTDAQMMKKKEEYYLSIWKSTK